MTITRPKIFEPSIRVYEKPVHPEFFKTVASKRICRKGYEVSLSITNAGHVVCWSDGKRTLTEILNVNVCELPQSEILFRSLRENNPKPLTLPESSLFNDLYFNRSQIEDVSPDFFGDFEKEFAQNNESMGLLYRFGFTGRMNLGGFSYIGIESRIRQMKVQTIHTFPDDCVLLKTETVISMKNVDS